MNPRAARRLAAASWTELTPAEERVRQILIEPVKRTDPRTPRGALITYGDLCATANPDQAYWKHRDTGASAVPLGHISTYEHEHEHEHGRPLLSALVVQKLTMRAGDGFASDLGRGLGFDIPPGGEHRFWLEQVEKVVRYWTGPGRDSAAVGAAAGVVCAIPVVIEWIRHQ